MAKHWDSFWSDCGSDMLAVPDPRKIITIAGGLSNINHAVMIWTGFRSDIECVATNLAN